MKSKGILVVTFFSLWIFSCKQKELTYDKPYFDFDSLIRTQIRGFSKTKVEVIKKTLLDGVKDSITVVPDTSQWKHELDAFQQLDLINKPMYKGQYLVDDSKDVHSNLTVRTYQKINSEVPTPVPEVKIYFQGNLKKLKRIESSFTEQNLMYGTSRKLTLEFDDSHDVPVLVHYRVKGVQKMIMCDSVKLSIEGWMRYLN
jgi:hypothetical protein